MRFSNLFVLSLLALNACAADSGSGDTAYSERSGLHWQRCAVGSEWDGASCVGEPIDLDWSDAADACAAFGPEYRLPTLEEVALLLGECSGPGEAARCAPCAASAECGSVLADERFDLTWTADPLADAVYVVDLGNGVIAYEEAARALTARCVTTAP